MYHDVCRDSLTESGFQRERDFPYKIKLDVFESHVKAVCDYCNKNQLSKNQIQFTFDDGGKSFYTIIAPLLEQYGFKGIFFISTKYIGSNAFLDEHEIIDLDSRGHIIGSHAHTHEHLYKLSQGEINEEWKKSSDILCELLHKKIEYASIPNGDISESVLNGLCSNGFKYIYNSEPTTRIKQKGQLLIYGRYVIQSSDDKNKILKLLDSKYYRGQLYVRRLIIRCVKSILGEKYIAIKTKLFSQN